MHNTPSYDPPFELPTQEYYQLIHTLTPLLPPPLADTPEALRARDQAALDQVAALLPTNSNEAGLAAQCIAARAQAEDMLRLIRKHAEDDVRVVIRLNAQYAAMVRTSLGAYGYLLRAQAIRHKREQSNATLSADQWTQHIAASAMQQALDAGPPAKRAAEPTTPAAPPAAPAAPVAAQTPAPVPTVAPPAAPATPVAAQKPAPAPTVAPPAAPATPVAAQTPAPVPTAAPPPALPAAPAIAPPAAPPPPPPPATGLPAPPAPARTPAPRRTHGLATSAEPDEPPRDLPSEAERYAVVYPHRAREIRHHGGLPPSCTFGPPDDELVRAIVAGTTPALRALDGANAAAAE